ncbi:TIGR02186 family protein [Desulfofundulus salinus]|uniref:TIGR02186 family protein n=1 Tax=Desulfofundulus salinus TaxID=2419843 RepID=UPI00338E2507
MKLTFVYPAGENSSNGTRRKSGKVVGSQEGSFTVRSEGLVYWLRLLSGTNDPVYGGLAVIIALFAGVAIGMVFSWIDCILGKGATGGVETHAH